MKDKRRNSVANEHPRPASFIPTCRDGEGAGGGAICNDLTEDGNCHYPDKSGQAEQPYIRQSEHRRSTCHADLYAYGSHWERPNSVAGGSNDYAYQHGNHYPSFLCNDHADNNYHYPYLFRNARSHLK